MGDIADSGRGCVIPPPSVRSFSSPKGCHSVTLVTLVHGHSDTHTQTCGYRARILLKDFAKGIQVSFTLLERRTWKWSQKQRNCKEVAPRSPSCSFAHTLWCWTLPHFCRGKYLKMLPQESVKSISTLVRCPSFPLPIILPGVGDVPENRVDCKLLVVGDFHSQAVDLKGFFTLFVYSNRYPPES